MMGRKKQGTGRMRCVAFANDKYKIWEKLQKCQERENEGDTAHKYEIEI